MTLVEAVLGGQIRNQWSRQLNIGWFWRKYGRGGNFTMKVMFVYLYLGPVNMSPVSEISLYL